MWTTLKALGAKFINYVATLPPSGVIKLGIIAGVAAFTAVILVKRVMKMYKESHAEVSQNRSPVDDILGVNYVTNPDAFAELDPEAQRICRKLNKSAKKHRKPKKFKSQKKANKPQSEPKVITLFDEDGVVDSASQMMWAQQREGTKGNAKPKRRRKATIDKAHLMELKKVCEEWKSSGLDAECFRDQIDAIAKEIGLPVDALDQAISDSVRSEFGALF